MRATPSIVLASLATLLLGCSDATGPSQSSASIRPPTTPQSRPLLIAPASATLRSGENRQFAATFALGPTLAAGPIAISWSSTNEQVATVSASGLVHAVSGGQTQIVATWGGYRAHALVTVAGAMKKHEGAPACLLASLSITC